MRLGFELCRQLFGLGALLGAGIAAAATGPEARVFYIDFERGSDRASGLSPGEAWKRAPGDSRAESRARAARLMPGDRLQFRAGVRYRGTIVARTAGTMAAPILYEGRGWGDGAAILDGSDRLPSPRACRSARDCLGAPQWRRLMRVRLPEGARWTDGLFADDGQLVPAQWPAPGAFAALPAAALRALQEGRIETGLPEDLSAGEPVLALRVRPGETGYSPGATVTAQGIAFPREGWAHWGFAPQPGDNRYALVNVPAMVDRPGSFALSADQRVAILWPVRGALTLGSGRQGFNLMAGGHVTVRGFDFRNFAGGNPWSRMAGIPLVQRHPLPGVSLVDNRFAGMAGTARQSAMLLPADGRPELSGNRIEPGAISPVQLACREAEC